MPFDQLVGKALATVSAPIERRLMPMEPTDLLSNAAEPCSRAPNGRSALRWSSAAGHNLSHLRGERSYHSQI
jgi:hypothetical protein